VRISRDPHFHWKSYTAVRKTQTTIIVGSSNLTADGLQNSGELNLTVQVATTSGQFRDINRVFDDEWSRSVPIESTSISEYKRQRSQLAKPMSGRRLDLPAILKVPADAKNPSSGTDVRGAKSPKQRSYWRDCTEG
jgi:hypothetical protein